MQNNAKKEHERHPSNFNNLNDIQAPQGDTKANPTRSRPLWQTPARRLIVLIIIDFSAEIKHRTDSGFCLNTANKRRIMVAFRNG
jgi:hypothetical protein